MGEARQFEIGTNFRAWAFQIARYKLLQHKTRRQRGCVCFSDALVDELVLHAAAEEHPLNGSTTCAAALPRCRRGTGN